MQDDITLIGIPKDTLELVQLVAKKTGKSMVDVLSEAVLEKARKHLTPAEPAKVEAPHQKPHQRPKR